MKISELSSRSGVSPATLKFYIREGLVPEGERIGANRTEYTDAHVQRVRLVRALLVTGHLTITAARDVLNAIDTHSELGPAFATAQHAFNSDAAPASDTSRSTIEHLIAAHGWSVGTDNPGIHMAALALDGFAAIDAPLSRAFLDAYVAAADLLARADFEAIDEASSHQRSEAVVEFMVIGTIMGDGLASGLRRIAHEARFANTTISGTDSRTINPGEDSS